MTLLYKHARLLKHFTVNREIELGGITKMDTVRYGFKILQYY